MLSKWIATVSCAVTLGLWIFSTLCYCSFGNGRTYFVVVEQGEIFLRWTPGHNADPGIFGDTRIAGCFSQPVFKGVRQVTVGSHPTVWDTTIPLWLIIVLTGGVLPFLWIWDRRVVRVRHRREQGCALHAATTYYAIRAGGVQSVGALSIGLLSDVSQVSAVRVYLCLRT